MQKNTFNWNSKAKWIGTGPSPAGWTGAVIPAPFFRKQFTLEKIQGTENIAICGLGYYELYLNGKKVGDHVLDPVVTHYDKRALYVTYDVSEYLVEGENVMGVVLGNGWYNSHTPEVWHFDKAPWRANPKFLLQMNIANQCFLTSDKSWKFTSGPITFDGLRNGETYDAGLELDGWLTTDYNDTDWQKTAFVAPPGGVLEEQLMPPCKVMQTLPSVAQWEIQGKIVYDIGQNMAGWARISVRGEKGAKITLKYGDQLDESRNLDQSMISKHVLVEDGQFQTDRYTLKGEGLEVWEPRFTYHGFQYVQVEIEGNSTVEKLEGRVVHTAFEKIGNFKCSDKKLNKIQECTEWSFIGNFVGIPTDCPHREKNGWTGDAHLAAETGLFNYDTTSSYAQWLDMVVDSQRPSGQLPGIVPCVGWGYNWGSGPAWDSALILIPWYIYLYTGDDSIIHKHYGAMKKYIDYCTTMADDHIVEFGLGDWGHPDRHKNPQNMAPTVLTDTAYYYNDTVLLAKFAELTGRKDDCRHYSKLAEEIKEAFNKRFYKGDGIYANGVQTALGCALYQGLVEESEKEAVVNALVNKLEATDYKHNFGILGAKYIPRALADNGRIDEAYKFLTHPQSLWMHWVEVGANTFWESWVGQSSHNHIMYGDLSAWMYQYAAGITPDEKNPGFRKLTIKPNILKGLDNIRVKYQTPQGQVVSAWEKTADKVMFTIEIPAGIDFEVKIADAEIQQEINFPGEYSGMIKGKKCFISVIENNRIKNTQWSKKILKKAIVL